ncbi:MAG: HEAT repeat domain-containing protein [Anaerolineaceae bacterium]
MEKRKQISLSKIIEALLDENTPFPPSYLYRFSDLEQKEIDRFKKIWNKVPVWRRQALMDDIEELGDSDYVLSFEAFALFALHDEDPIVREIAIRSLWDYDSREAIKPLIEALQHDPVTEVKAAAASALGKFVYLGELDEIPPKAFHESENLLLEKIESNEPLVIRCRALEAMGYSSHEAINDIIQNAYQSENIEWKASALSAMGKSANDYWIPHVKSMLDSEVRQLRYEAAKSAGELEAKSCIPGLVLLLDDADTDISMAALWSLSQIGGKGIREILEKRLEESLTDDEADFIESALENLEFTDNPSLFSLLEYSAAGDEFDDIDDDFFDLIDEDED